VPSLAFALTALVTSAPQLAEAVTVTPERVAAELRRLDPKSPLRERKLAANWFDRHAARRPVISALPALEKSAKADPDAVVRGLSVLAVGRIAVAHGKPCPDVVFDALYDDGEYGGVRLLAEMALSRFKTLPPGSTEKLVRYATSPRREHRGHGLSLLATHAPRSFVTRKLLRAATADPDRRFRHNAFCSLFRATGNLDDFLAYILRFQSEFVDREADRLLGLLKEDEEEAGWWGVANLGMGLKLAEWAQDRPADLRDALVKAMAHPDAQVRRGAAACVGRIARAVREPNAPDAAVKSEQSPELGPVLQREGRAVVAQAVRDRLADLAGTDPDPRVRSAAS
jgi:hypothetical protein